MGIVQVRPEHLNDWLQSVSARSDVEHLEGTSGQAVATLLDVREPWEVQTASVAHSSSLADGMRFLHIPMRELKTRMGEIQADEPVAVLCHHGARSLQVALWLESQGFDDVANVQGGIDSWARDFDPAVVLY